MITAVTVEPRTARCEPWRLIQPRCAAQQTTAAAVSARKPAMTPIAKARHRIIEVDMARNYHEIARKMKRDGGGKRADEECRKKRGPGLGSRAPKVALR